MKKITLILISFLFLGACAQTAAMLGPAITIGTTGNVMQAGFQYGANTTIKKETGKNSFEHLQEIVSNHYDDKN